jgi:hypothetical protein
MPICSQSKICPNNCRVVVFFKIDAINTDNFVFKLHYVATVTGLITFSVLLSLGQVMMKVIENQNRYLNNYIVQLVGDPIDCVSDADISGDLIDRFCWVEGTWTRHTPIKAGEGKKGVRDGYIQQSI